MSMYLDLVLDSIIFSLQRAGGISLYWSELIKGTSGLGHNVVSVEGRNSEENVFRSTLEKSSLSVYKSRGIPRIERYMPANFGEANFDVFHSSYYRMPRRRNGVVIQTCYDFAYERFRSGLPRAVHSLQKYRALKNADGIICISESTRRDLFSFFPDLSSKPTRVIYLAASKDFRSLSDGEAVDQLPTVIPTSERFVVFVGERGFYKNFAFAVEGVALCEDYHLVLVGGGPVSAAERVFLDRHLSNRWVHLSGISSRSLNAIFNRAQALVYPSSFEGFGIPILEAMQAGCPVICGSSSSIPEVAGSSGLTVDLNVPENVSEHLRALEDSSWRSTVRESGLENASRFSWDSCSSESISFYNSI